MTLKVLCNIFFVTCILFSKTAAANVIPVCKDEEAILDCSVPGGTWKYKKVGETIQTSLTEWRNGHNRVSPQPPQMFDGLITVDDKNTLTIASFKSEHNGTYMCKSNTRVLYHVIAVQCKAEACIGDQVTLECGSFLGAEQIRELSWHVNNLKALIANESLQVEYQKDRKFYWLDLSEDISAALKVLVVSPYVQRLTCVTHGVPDGVTPRRSSVTLYPKYCATNITVINNTRMELECPYYGMRKYYPQVTQITWTKGSRNVRYDKRVRSAHGSLIIDPASHQDKGTYTCSIVQKRDGAVLASHGVTVHVTQSTKVDSDASVHGVTVNVTQSTEVSSDASVHGVIIYSHGNRVSVTWLLVGLIAGYVISL